MSLQPDRRLVLMRHAKTESVAPRDHDRTLTDRGRRDARSAAAWLVDQDLAPTVVLVSSAVRARSTCDEVCAVLGTAPDVRVLDSLYHGDEYDLVEACVAELRAPTDVAMVIGHNPTVSMAATVLQPDDGGQDVALPTAAVAVLQVGSPWPDLAPGTARLLEVHRVGG
jgi:phosphohistidine phosphatase